MTGRKVIKINQLLQHWPKGTVAVNSWLEEFGAYRQLKKSYKDHGWLEQIGSGAVKRSGDTVDWQGGLYAIQAQLKKAVHIGGRSSLELQGRSHNLRLKEKEFFLFAARETRLPKWFLDNEWSSGLKLIKSNFLPEELALREFAYHDFTLTISSLERAILECLYLVPKYQDFQEAYYLLEGLMDIHPNLLQNLLEECNSIKVKRLFLFMAEKAKLPCLKKLNINRVDIGSGKRVIVANGHYDPQYRITYPKEFQVDE